MPKKKSIKLSVQKFKDSMNDILSFINAFKSVASDKHYSWIHDAAIIRVYRSFETLMLEVLVALINKDPTILQSTTGIKFPKQLTDEVCEYLITGGGYFDFKGKSGLIKVFKQFVPSSHPILCVIKKPEYDNAIEKLSSLRNFAAHGSRQSKRAALAATGSKYLSSSGSWLKVQNRFRDLINCLIKLADDIEANWP
jgi:hypothetical protein